MRAFALAILLLGCGGPAAPAEEAPDDGCDVARLEAERAWREVAQEAESISPPSSGPAIGLEGVLDRLEAHVVDLEGNPHEIEGEDAFELANAIMGGLDEVATDIPDSLRQRADDAAEAVLTDRGAQGAARAARDAMAVVEEVIQQARPGRAAARSQRWGAAELVRRATAAAEAYGEGVAQGDRAASRAEDLRVEGLSVEGLSEPRTAAADASRRAREACGVRRALDVPPPA